MRFLYYPGCSLKSSGRAYEESILAVFAKLDFPIEELADWNCCGATAYMGIDEKKAFALAARNLALAEQSFDGETVQLVAPCAACYLVLLKTQKYMVEYKSIGRDITSALNAVGLEYRGRVQVRHPLDVLIREVGLDRIRAAVSRPVEGMKVACYYGCQTVRPFAEYDDQYNPMTMDHLLRACGAETIDWPAKVTCCGAMLNATIEKVGQRRTYMILHEAIRRGVDVVATACPLCQFNLECFQGQISHRYSDRVQLPVAYFTQILGKAMGLDERALGLHRLFIPLRQRAAAV
ncbi:MAG: CoB--CoM heterodisulfide reductase iron-sulfur subunit B family protein [Pirellulales bacterium]|nr:CoB--CoM heterodisulfide reductase iron-sulfur subunit B family protein [Pirellulales bacterium]